MSKKKIPVINYCFIVLFLLMLFVPLILVDLTPNRISVQENRGLANFPNLIDIKYHPGYFIYQYDAWFKDSTGFREQLMSLYNILNKNKLLIGFRYAEGQYTYLEGEEGHHYFADVNGRLIPKFQGKQYLSVDQLQNMAVKLEEVKTYLDNKGIPLVVMLCTDKESVYPEFYPKSIKPGPEPIQLDIITNYLLDRTSVDIFNIRQALLAEKANYLLYYKIDAQWFTNGFAHYNEIGAFFAYRELMKHINIHIPNITPYELDEIEISYDEKEIPYVSFKDGKKYKKLDASFFNGFNSNEWAFDNAFENIESDLPVILFFSDSYGLEQYIGKFFAQQFGQAIFTHYANFEHIEEYIDRFNPDIVVFESAERGLERFAECITSIPDL